MSWGSSQNQSTPNQLNSTSNIATNEKKVTALDVATKEMRGRNMKKATSREAAKGKILPRNVKIKNNMAD